MAIGSVKELIDYETETIKIAKKYGGGGGSVDLSLIADNYNPDRTTTYPTNDMVVYEGKLYRATSQTLPGAGVFNSTMWDKIPDYDSTQTYNNYDYAVYEGQIYRCDESNVTGEWDSTKWTEVSADFPEYNSTEVYYAYGSRKCTYEGDFYKTNSSYVNSGTVGEFKPLRWTETTVEEALSNLKSELVNYVNNRNLYLNIKNNNFASIAGENADEGIVPVNPSYADLTDQSGIAVNTPKIGDIIHCLNNGCTYKVTSIQNVGTMYMQLKLIAKGNNIKLFDFPIWHQTEDVTGLHYCSYNYNKIWKILSVYINGGYNTNSGEIFLPTLVKDTNANTRNAIKVIDTSLQTARSIIGNCTTEYYDDELTMIDVDWNDNEKLVCVKDSNFYAIRIPKWTI